MIREFFLTLVQSAALHTRDRIIEVLKAMPADATVDDAIERLVFLAKIESGLAELDVRTPPRFLPEWLVERSPRSVECGAVLAVPNSLPAAESASPGRAGVPAASGIPGPSISRSLASSPIARKRCALFP